MYLEISFESMRNSICAHKITFHTRIKKKILNYPYLLSAPPPPSPSSPPSPATAPLLFLLGTGASPSSPLSSTGAALLPSSVSSPLLLDWCEAHQVEMIRTNVVRTLTLADLYREQGLMLINYAIGCIFEYDDAHPLGSGIGFKEKDTPNFIGSFYGAGMGREGEGDAAVPRKERKGAGAGEEGKGGGGRRCQRERAWRERKG